MQPFSIENSSLVTLSDHVDLTIGHASTIDNGFSPPQWAHVEENHRNVTTAPEDGAVAVPCVVLLRVEMTLLLLFSFDAWLPAANNPFNRSSCNFWND